MLASVPVSTKVCQPALRLAADTRRCGSTPACRKALITSRVLLVEENVNLLGHVRTDTRDLLQRLDIRIHNRIQAAKMLGERQRVASPTEECRSACSRRGSVARLLLSIWSMRFCADFHPCVRDRPAPASCLQFIQIGNGLNHATVTNSSASLSPALQCPLPRREAKCSNAPCACAGQIQPADASACAALAPSRTTSEPAAGIFFGMCTCA